MPTLVRPQCGWLPSITKVQIQTHSHCNANCLMCPWIESSHNTVNKGRMTDETWDMIMHNLSQFPSLNHHSSKIVPYLMNEPLIDKKIFEWIASIYSWFPNTTVEISTNGAALTDSVIDKLFAQFEGRHHDLWVSHHGIDAESLEHIMQIDFERAQANLLNLLKKSDGRFTIKIRGTGESRDGKHVIFTRKQYLDHWDQLFKEHNINRTNVSVDAFTFHDRAGQLHRTERGANLLNMGTIRQIDPQHPFYCPRVDQWLHFGWDGQIILCCMDYHNSVKLPNINETSLLEYFHGPAYLELTETISGRKPCSPDFICAKCASPGG